MTLQADIVMYRSHALPMTTSQTKQSKTIQRLCIRQPPDWLPVTLLYHKLYIQYCFSVAWMVAGTSSNFAFYPQVAKHCRQTHKNKMKPNATKTCRTHINGKFEQLIVPERLQSISTGVRCACVGPAISAIFLSAVLKAFRTCLAKSLSCSLKFNHRAQKYILHN